MNENIKRCWDEAARLETDQSWEGQTRFMEKFAELIVRDCYVALFPALRDMISRGQAYDMIKQHFGVDNNNAISAKETNN